MKLPSPRPGLLTVSVVGQVTRQRAALSLPEPSSGIVQGAVSCPWASLGEPRGQRGAGGCVSDPTAAGETGRKVPAGGRLHGAVPGLLRVAQSC